jgi:hypothetical protein
MTSKSISALCLGACLLAAVPVRAAPVQGPQTLADSTVVESWVLDNGLRVVTRHIPKARAVAVTLGYDIGSDDDPAGVEGMAQVMAELFFTSAAGDIPERNREELNSQRPMGWSFPVSHRSTLFTEIASFGQFPGVLSQVATRMKGVQVTAEGLTKAVENARNELRQQLYGPVLGALYQQTRAAALDRKDADILRRASGRDLGTITLAQASERMQRLYVPRNAVLSLAGNLRGLELKKVLASLFGSIPPGQPVAHPSPAKLQPGSRVIRLQGIPAAAGVMGIIAPALDDSLHPSFYLNALLAGSHFNRMWGEEGKASSRHHYAVFDEPDLLRVFPPVDKGETTEAMNTTFRHALGALSSMIVTAESYEEVRAGALWMLGGPMLPELAERARSDSGVLHTLARTMAARALWGGEGFWADYRQRFASEPAGNLTWCLTYFADSSHQVRLIMQPR